MTVSIGLFHEELSLIQRDRNAAFFAQDDGARILLCSEIGSEGRNFQFCRHLVFWDLPLDCELVEQRIGRLDRIGQKNDVIIHVPCIQNTCMEVLCRWYHEGIDIFSHAVPAAQEVFETCKEALVTIATTACKTPDSWRKDLESLILAAKKAVALQTAELEAGRDRLLELHSYRPQPAQAIVNAIKAMDTDTFLELFFLDLLKANGVFFELIGKRTYKLWSESPLDETFPALRTSRPLITFDRATALTREDMEFVTIDHPAVRNGLDSFLGSDKGNACLATWKGCKETGLLLETVFVVECIAPPELNVERFLPPTPIRFVIDHTGKERPDICALTNFENKVSECLDIPLLQNETVQQTLLPALQKKAMALASAKSEPVITAAQQEMQKAVGSEVKRLIELAAINPSISQDEIDLSKEALETLNRLIKAAEPRLDSVRLIWMDKGK
jgi:ATP-dependent helicase HepA